MTGINLDPDMKARLSDVFNGPGWSVQTDHTMTGKPCLRLSSGPRGTGRPRAKYLIVGDDLPSLFHALSAILITMGVQ